MAPDLSTTNVLLGIMAAVSLLEAIAVVGLLLGAFLIHRRVMQVLGSIEERQVAPALARLNAILDDVKSVTATVRQETGRIDRLVDWILDALGRRRRRPDEERSSNVM